MLGTVSAILARATRSHSTDVRMRITHVARTLIALAALLFCMPIIIGMYVRRNRQRR